MHTHSCITSPAALYRCCSGSAVSAGKGGGDRAGHGGESAGSGTVPLLPCGGEVHSLEAGSARLATQMDSSVGSPPETKERKDGQTQAQLEQKKVKRDRRDTDCPPFLTLPFFLYACVTYIKALSHTQQRGRDLAVFQW